MTERGDRVRVRSRTGSVWRFVGDLKKVRELSARHQTRRSDFWSSQTRGELAPYGGALELGAKWIRQHSKICVSPPYVETFNSKLIKRFRTWTNKSLRVFEFRDSYILYMFYRYEHYMSISQMVLIVAIVHFEWPSLWCILGRVFYNVSILRSALLFTLRLIIFLVFLFINLFILYFVWMFFSHKRWLIVSSRSLSGRKSPQVSLSIQDSSQYSVWS